ncbi:hypothetical protein AUJ14_04435 [Candidatus Micrarchaeota archaeon CG1_02_55_22]|nr:MAG: hypothetical protein AUJ14_04435 [Candidatus Micrarchaeota archaeon CG1_02_55_22]
MKVSLAFALLLFSSLVVGASWLGAENSWYTGSTGPVTYSHVQTSSYKSDSWSHYERTVNYGVSSASSGGFEAFGFSSGNAYSYGSSYAYGPAYGSYYASNSFPSTYYYPSRFDGYGYYYGYTGHDEYCYSCGCAGWRC